MTKDQIAAVLEGVRSWPEQDQEELAELAREIEARRSGTYIMTDDERAAIARARQTPIASGEDAAALWKSHSIV
jgi:hypothetical protein